VNTGLKLFVKHDMKEVDCPYRLCEEGLTWIRPHMEKRIAYISKKDLFNLLENIDPLFHTFEERTQDQLRTLGNLYNCNIS
jgi:hypothetical protein